MNKTDPTESKSLVEEARVEARYVLDGYFPAGRAGTADLLTRLANRVEELEAALRIIAEDDDLVVASGGAWVAQALERRQAIARQALSTQPH